MQINLFDLEPGYTRYAHELCMCEALKLIEDSTKNFLCDDVGQSMFVIWKDGKKTNRYIVYELIEYKLKNESHTSDSTS